MLLGALVAAAAPAHAAVNDPGLSQQWALPMVGAPDAWATGTGAGVSIAVVDTGGHYGHEDLAAKLLPGRNFVADGAAAQDDNGHGSHVAGIAAAATNNQIGIAGVAPDAKVVPVKVLAADGTGSVQDVIDGIEWAADQRIPVINLSLGDDANFTALLGPSFGDAIEYAWKQGSICVISAGNTENRTYDFVTSPQFGSHNALVVTSLSKAGTKPAKARPVSSAKWGLAAPGGDPDGKAEDNVLSAWVQGSKTNAYAYAAGTSMAAPHVAAAAAVLRGLGLGKQETVDRLLATARDVGPAGKDTTYGYGAVDLKAAVAGLKPAGGGGSTATTAKPTTQTTRAGSTGGGGTVTTTRPGAGPPTTDGAVSNVGGVAPVDAGDLNATDDGAGGDSAGADETASGPGDEGDGGSGDRPWPALAVALVTLLGAVALLAGAVRPKPT